MPLWGIRKIARMQPICNAVRRRFMLKILSVVTLSLRYTGAGTCDRPQNILDLFAYANFISFVDAVHYLHLLYFFCILTARVHQIVLTLTFLLNFVFSLTLRSTLFALIARRCMWNTCDRMIWAAFSFLLNIIQLLIVSNLAIYLYCDDCTCVNRTAFFWCLNYISDTSSKAPSAILHGHLTTDFL